MIEMKWNDLIDGRGDTEFIELRNPKDIFISYEIGQGGGRRGGFKIGNKELWMDDITNLEPPKQERITRINVTKMLQEEGFCNYDIEIVLRVIAINLYPLSNF